MARHSHAPMSEVTELMPPIGGEKNRPDLARFRRSGPAAGFFRRGDRAASRLGAGRWGPTRRAQASRLCLRFPPPLGGSGNGLMWRRGESGP